MLYTIDLTLVTVLILGAFAAAFCLLAVWAGLAQQPAWYWRAAAMCAAVWMLFPIEAYEPAALFLMVMPLTALGAYITCGRPSASAKHTKESKAHPGPWRFTLRDLMLATLLSGLVSAMIAILWQKEDINNFLGLIGLAAGLSAVAVFSTALVVAKRYRWLYGLALVACLGATIAAHSMFDLLGLKQIIFLQTAANVLLHCLLAYAAFSLLLVAALALAPLALGDVQEEKSAGWRGWRRAAGGLLVVGGMVLAAPMSAVYWWMLEKPNPPPHSSPRDNSLPRVLALVNEAQRLNVSQGAVVEVTEAGNPETAAKLSQLYRKIGSALEADGHVELEFPKSMSAGFIVPPEISLLRGQGRAWNSEAEWAASQGRFDDASNYGLLSARLGHAYSRGGAIIQCLVGIAIEGAGVSKLAETRDDISLDRARELILQLEHLDRSREDLDLTLVRDAVWMDCTFGWRWRLGVAITKLRGRRHEEPGAAVLRSALQRRDAKVRLLLTELAIRAYCDQHGQLPPSLSDLCPEFLASPPLDPYSGQPLVYRKTAEGYLLYSVWQGGVDNGGQFMTSLTQWNTPGFDLDLDLQARTSTPATGS